MFSPLKTLAFAACLVPLAGQLLQAADDEITVHFRLHAPELAVDAPVYITGSVPGLGNWNPGKIRMMYLKEHIWAHDLVVSQKQTIEYKYTLGTWEREGASADGRPLQNLVVDVHKSIEKQDEILFWTDRKSTVKRGQITGQVKYHRAMKGEGIRPRDIIVWLPPEYDASDSRYPVLYMHDGQNIIDPQTSAFGVDWEVDETCTRLIAAKHLTPLIVVGIYNTPDRSREYLPGATGSAYMNFVAQTLKPFIDDQYRTKPARTHTYTAGSSAGGLCAFMLVWEHSDVFSKAICMSPAFTITSADGVSRLDYVNAVRMTGRPKDRIFVYLDNGGVGLEKNLQPGIDNMMLALRVKGLTPERDFHWLHAPADRHDESAWARRFATAIRMLVGAD